MFRNHLTSTRSTSQIVPQGAAGKASPKPQSLPAWGMSFDTHNAGMNRIVSQSVLIPLPASGCGIYEDLRGSQSEPPPHDKYNNQQGNLRYVKRPFRFCKNWKSSLNVLYRHTEIRLILHPYFIIQPSIPFLQPQVVAVQYPKEYDRN